MTGVIYARYSSDNQREESIEGQIRECLEYAEHNDITIVHQYIDRALTARTADRPDFQRMIKDSEKELFNVVLVWKLDRFSRDRYDNAYYKHILKKHNVRVLSATEVISDGPEGIIMEAMLEGMAEYYSAELSEKIKRGQKENALKCKSNGAVPPMGYYVNEDRMFEIDPVTAPVVLEIFHRYADGDTMQEIVDAMNGRGIRTGKGKPFRIGSLGTMLKNRKYLGEYRYGDTVVPGGMPALIDDKLFERVQRRMEGNKHAPARAKADEEYLLTTKLFCGDCGTMMVGESGTSGSNGNTYYYYKCGNAKRKQGCHRKPLKKHWIETAVVRLTVSRVLRDQEIDRIADAIIKLQGQEDTTLPALQRQLQECEKGIENMLNAIQQGILTASTKSRLEQLEEQKETLEISIMQAKLAKPRFTKEQVVKWISRFKFGDENSREYQKELIDTFVNSVYVFDNKLVMTYNFKEGTESITLSDVETALSSDLSQDAPHKKRPSFMDGLFLC